MSALLAYVIFCTPPVATPTAAIANVTAYADVELRWSKGEVSVLKVRPGRFDKPTTLPRFRGRFTAIVARGKASLVELTFDFPLLADTESNDATPEARALAERLRKGVTTGTVVRVPLPDGADTLVIYDALTQKTVKAHLGSASAPPVR